MFYSKLKIVMCLLFIFPLSGCGGSGGDSEESTPASEQAESVTSQIQASSDEIQNLETVSIEMSELRASPDFSFTSKQQTLVTLDLIELLDDNNQAGERAYISIYRDYERLPSGEFYPDSSSRVLAGELDNGLFNNTFTSLNNQSTYLIEVWFYDGSEPIQKETMVIANNLTW